MAGAGLGRKSRGRYTAAGYVHGEDDTRELYIERVQAGSAQDLLRDNNRVGYGAPELDDDGLPFSFFIEEEERERARLREREERERRAKEKAQRKALSLPERFMRAYKRERHAAKLCFALLAINLVLVLFAVQACIVSVRIQDSIRMYESGSAAYQAEIDAANVQLEMARNGERVRNIAQNELGMLRSERMDTQKIYIQTSGLAARAPVQDVQEERGSSLLDWLLSVADIFDFKS